jgi:hypothetical protein
MLLAENRPKDAIPHLVLGDDEPCRTLEVHNMLVIAYDVTDGHDAMCRYAARHKRGWDDLYLTDPVYKDAQRRVASCSVPQ